MGRPSILNPLVTALVLLLAGCPAVPRPADAGRAAASFSIVAPDARTVAIAGTFNRWDPKSHFLSGPDRQGRWTITMPLPFGRYEYLFVINEVEWVPDPAAPSVDSGLGGRNSIVTLPSELNGEK